MAYNQIIGSIPLENALRLAERIRREGAVLGLDALVVVGKTRGSGHVLADIQLLPGFKFPQSDEDKGLWRRRITELNHLLADDPLFRNDPTPFADYYSRTYK